MKRRDVVAVSALRSALAAIANAEAVPLPAAPSGPPAGSAHVAGGVTGPGGAEAGRRAVTEEEAAAIAAAEAAERRGAARDYRAAGHPGRAERLLREAGAIEAALNMATSGDDA
jgi:uncharacterized protein